MIGGHGGNIYEMARRHGCLKDDFIDMSNNINPLGPPAGLLEYLKTNMAAAVTRLPEVDSRETVEQYAACLSVDSEQILAGNGTTQFIYSIPRVLHTQKALIVGPTYSDYADACRLHHASTAIMIASETANFHPNLDRLEKNLESVDTVFLCNPNNPTGFYLPPSELLSLCRRHDDTRFVIDESYLPFVSEGKHRSMAHSQLDNVIVLLSISKIVAIPGLRIGFLIAAAGMIKNFRRHLPPWSVNSVAQRAVNYLTTHDRLIRSFVNDTRNYIQVQREQFFKTLKQSSLLKCYPSAAPFFLIRLADTISSDRICSRLADEKVLIRNCNNFPGLSGQFIRISLKTPSANRMLAESLVSLVDESVNRLPRHADIRKTVGI